MAEETGELEAEGYKEDKGYQVGMGGGGVAV